MNELTMRDPYELLMTIGSSKEGLFLVGTPIVLLLLIIITIAILAVKKKRREARDLTQAVDAMEETPNLTDQAPGKESASRTKSFAPSEVGDKDPWLTKLRDGLAKTRNGLEKSLAGLFSSGRKLDEDTLDRLHESLYRADIGVKTVDKLIDHLRRELGKEDSADWTKVASCLREQAKAILNTAVSPLNFNTVGSPTVILIVGVNGVGKTTSIGKLAAHYLEENKKVLLGAGDTYRAAATEQLAAWGERVGASVVKHQQGSDPAAVAYDTVKAAIARRADIALIDTAGRLHSKNELMQELSKIKRVIGRDLPGAPHEVWLVIDATTGQNAIQQVSAFQEIAAITGIVVTKLDGTAKGGVVLAIADQFKLPIRYIGVGEQTGDLKPFDPSEYAASLF